MIITTGEIIPNKKIIQIVGISRGSTVRARHIGNDIFAWFKNIIGGEIHEYTKSISEHESLYISFRINPMNQKIKHIINKAKDK